MVVVEIMVVVAYITPLAMWYLIGFIVCDEVRGEEAPTKQTTLLRFLIKTFWPVVGLYYLLIVHPLRIIDKWNRLPDTPKDTLKQL